MDESFSCVLIFRFSWWLTFTYFART